MAAIAGKLDWLGEFIAKNLYTSIHIAICLYIIFTVSMGIVYFIITKLIIQKKLNLE